jgi:hypothetical protein
MATEGSVLYNLLAAAERVKPINLVILLTPEMGYVPSYIKVIQDYGSESIVHGDGNELVEGNSMYIQGDEAALLDWLRPFKEVWTSSNPMCGEWKLLPVRQ